MHQNSSYDVYLFGVAYEYELSTASDVIHVSDVVLQAQSQPAEGYVIQDAKGEL